MDYETSMITDEDPKRELLFYWNLVFSLTLHILQEKHRPRIFPRIQQGVDLTERVHLCCGTAGSQLDVLH